jgi:hypothetical protein
MKLFSSGRLLFYLINTPFPFCMGCPTVIPFQFVTNGVCIDNFALCRHVRILIIIVECYIKVLGMHWNTHDRLSSMMRPGADPNVIYRVNRAMDNPDPWSMRMYQTRKNSGYAHSFDVPGLRINGHRAPNHNWMSAMMTGYMYRGKEGMYAAANHLMQDFS